MNNEDWKTWPEPPKTGVVVVWTNENGKLRMATHTGDWWYLTASSYARTWPELLAHIDTYSDGTPPRIVDLAEPAPEPEAPESERVVVWKTGDDLDKLRAYVGTEGIEVRAEREGTVVVGPLKRVYAGLVEVGALTLTALTLTASRWSITVTAPKPVAPWWEVEGIEKGHVVSWTYGTDCKTDTIVWSSAWNLTKWRAIWDKDADPTTWRVTDVRAAGGPKLIAGTA